MLLLGRSFRRIMSVPLSALSLRAANYGLPTFLFEATGRDNQPERFWGGVVAASQSLSSAPTRPATLKGCLSTPQITAVARCANVAPFPRAQCNSAVALCANVAPSHCAKHQGRVHALHSRGLKCQRVSGEQGGGEPSRAAWIFIALFWLDAGGPAKLRRLGSLLAVIGWRSRTVAAGCAQLWQARRLPGEQL